MLSFQREVNVSLAEIEEKLAIELANLETARKKQDLAACQPILSRAGNYYRMLGDYLMAIDLLTEALGLARQFANYQAEAVTLIRLATAIQYAGRQAEALPLFWAAVELCRAKAVKTYEDFALQHLAKCLVEMSDIGGAIPLFEQALALRQAKGDPELITSTERALTALYTKFRSQKLE